MLTIAWLLIASTVSLQPDTTVVLGLMERDLTGDGEPETLRLSWVAFWLGSRLSFTLEPLTRAGGFGAVARSFQLNSIGLGSPSSGSGSSQRRSFSDRQNSSTAFA